MYTDMNLPLSGEYSVGGRSITIHEENGGSPRLACATLGKVGLVQFVDANGVDGFVSFVQVFIWFLCVNLLIFIAFLV